MDVLAVSAKGASKPTHIMYQSNTSWLILKKCLCALISSGFLVQSGDDSRAEYTVTDAGKAVLRDYLGLVERAMASEGAGY